MSHKTHFYLLRVGLLTSKIVAYNLFLLIGVYVDAAYVMINTDLGFEEAVRTVLRGIEEIKEAYIVYGIYDILVKVEYGDKKKN